MIEQFHFLRPAWLLLLLPLLLSLWWLARRRFDSSRWRDIIDQRLLPFVLSEGGAESRGRLRWVLAAVAALAIVALAGPTWEQLPQPVFQRQSALVIALDLSRSMDATDVRPSRLARARHKIADILNLREEGQTALVVYAADAFVVTPLTDDSETIVNLLAVLESELMPAQGTRADRALELAFELFDNSGIARGDVLLISDGASENETSRISQLLDQRPGLRLSVLAVGTGDGGPVPLQKGGFLKNSDGAIVIASLDEAGLRQIAQQGNGVYAAITADDLDINALTYHLESGGDEPARNIDDRSADLWRELGPWLLLLAAPLAALAFRRGVVWCLPLALLMATPDADALDWQQLWRNNDQQALELFEQGDAAAAAERFDNEAWRASSQYKAGDYAGALDGWLRQQGEDALYNRGNALARLGRFDEALATYDTLLEQNPGHEDAIYNKQAIEEWLRQQQQQSQQQSGESEQPQSGEQAQSTQAQANVHSPI